MVSRMHYLPFLWELVRGSFLPFAPAMVDEIWFAHRGVALNWQLPIGVHFDALVPGWVGAGDGERSEQVLQLEVHFQRFPCEFVSS